MTQEGLFLDLLGNREGDLSWLFEWSFWSFPMSSKGDCQFNMQMRGMKTTDDVRGAQCNTVRFNHKDTQNIECVSSNLGENTLPCLDACRSSHVIALFDHSLLQDLSTLSVRTHVCITSTKDFDYHWLVGISNTWNSRNTYPYSNCHFNSQITWRDPLTLVSPN